MSDDRTPLESLPAHPEAERYAMADDESFQELMEDIRTRGVRNPVFLWLDPSGNEVVIDGRRRLEAVRRLKAEGWKCPPIPVEEFDGDESEIADEVRSLNEHRRHLTTAYLMKRRRERVAKVAELRMAGKSLPVIAKAVGVSLGQVQRDLETASILTGDKIEPRSGRSQRQGGGTYPARLPKREPVPAPVEPAAETSAPAAEPVLWRHDHARLLALVRECRTLVSSLAAHPEGAALRALCVADGPHWLLPDLEAAAARLSGLAKEGGV